MRAEPKIVTPFSIPASVSKPSMNSDMMRSTRHGSVRVNSGPTRCAAQQLLVLGDRGRQVVADRVVDVVRLLGELHRAGAAPLGGARRGRAPRLEVSFLGALAQRVARLPLGVRALLDVGRLPGGRHHLRGAALLLRLVVGHGVARNYAARRRAASGMREKTAQIASSAMKP